MKVTVLMENVTPSARFAARHGLSLFLESQGARILFDVGPDEFFLENALAVGVDVRSAHAVVISHGLSDHGGGLRAYLDATSKLLAPAPIYVNEHAFEPHAAGTPENHRNIGLDPALADDPRFLKIGDQVALGDNLFLFSAVSIVHPIVKSNGVLLEQAGEGFTPRLIPPRTKLDRDGRGAAHSCVGMLALRHLEHHGQGGRACWCADGRCRGGIPPDGSRLGEGRGTGVHARTRLRTRKTACALLHVPLHRSRRIRHSA